MTVKELRVSAGMKRREFAEYFGIDYRTVQKWELDTSNPEGRKCPEYLFNLMKYKLEKEGILKDGSSVLTVIPYGKTPKLFAREPKEQDTKTKGGKHR